MTGTGGEVAELDRRTATELLCHLAASAELCAFEPVHYGTFRLLDAVSRLSVALRDGGLDDPWLEELRVEIDAKKTLMMSDRDAYFAFLPEVSSRLARHLLEIDEKERLTGAGSAGE
ncbi:MAG: DUF6092 family protein [Candidatus Dormibacteraceae bacterium]